MSKLMWIAGLLLVTAGVVLGFMIIAAPAEVVGWGITLEMAAVLLVGGVLATGLGGVVNTLQSLAARPVETTAVVVAAEAPAAAIPEFGRRAAETAAVAVPAASAVAAEAVEEVSEPVRETIAALEQARQKIEQAFEPKAEHAEAAAEAVPAVEEVVAEVEQAVAETAEEVVEAPADEAAEEGQLYVIEERFIRQRPARILSDGTVEAETDEGWMRFENLEHLDEYLDAMAPANR